MNKLFPGIFIPVFMFLSLSVHSQDVVKIQRLAQPVEFDGQPFEASWQGLDFFRLTMNRPNFGNEPSEKSEVMIAYDDEYLWVGARLYMQDASKIFTASKMRDERLFGYDALGILIDTYNDNENALAFFTTPTGLRTDYAVSNDAAGGSGGQGPPGGGSMNMSWNTFWDVKTTRDDKGWYVEMRIPFSSLKFKPENDVATMGLIISRNISANNEIDTWPAIDPRYGFMGVNKPSLATTIEIEGARPKNPVYVSPYVIGGYSRDRIVNADTTAFVNDNNWDRNLGLDVKYNINSNLTLDLTVNTDFAQVEADDQQVNLTRYSLFFPEKRMFFQERSSIFSFGLGGFSDNLFYSRRIGMTDRGEPIRILGGARLAGRIGSWDFGLLDMQTAEHGSTPTENFGVLRMRRQVINPNSYVGGIFTSRIGEGGSQNYAYGLDGIFKLFGDDYLTMKWAQTFNKESDTSDIWSTDPFFTVNWERRSEEGFAYNLSYAYSGEKFNPGIGFVRREGVQGGEASLLYGWIMGEKSKIYSSAISFRAEYFERLGDGKMESLSMGPGFEIQTKKQYGIDISLEYQEEGVQWPFQISDSISIDQGNYQLVGLRGDLRTPDSKKLAARMEVEAGEFYDGLKYSIGVEPTLNLSSSFQLSVGYSFDAIRFPDRDKYNKLNIHNVNGRALVMFSTKLSASLLVQYVTTQDELLTNFRLRYNPREGNDFYLVFNESRNLNETTSIASEKPWLPNRMLDTPSYFNRTIMLKYTHTFKL